MARPKLVLGGTWAYLRIFLGNFCHHQLISGEFKTFLPVKGEFRSFLGHLRGILAVLLVSRSVWFILTRF